MSYKKVSTYDTASDSLEVAFVKNEAGETTCLIDAVNEWVQTGFNSYSGAVSKRSSQTSYGQRLRAAAAWAAQRGYDMVDGVVCKPAMPGFLVEELNIKVTPVGASFRQPYAYVAAAQIGGLKVRATGKTAKEAVKKLSGCYRYAFRSDLTSINATPAIYGTWVFMPIGAGWLDARFLPVRVEVVKD